MARYDEFATVDAWQITSRIIVSGLLLPSGLRFLALAIVFRTLDNSEDYKLVFAGCLALATLALALCLTFWKSGAPTWKHKVAVALVSLPAALELVIR